MACELVKRNPLVLGILSCVFTLSALLVAWRNGVFRPAKLSGYTCYPNEAERCLKLFNVIKMKNAAFEVCKQEGGYLAVIRSEEDNTFLHNLIQNKTEWAYIGLEQRSHWSYEWATGHSMNITKENGRAADEQFTAWVNKEAYDSEEREGYDDKNCVRMHSNKGVWTDVSCNSSLPFICEVYKT